MNGLDDNPEVVIQSVHPQKLISLRATSLRSPVQSPQESPPEEYGVHARSPREAGAKCGSVHTASVVWSLDWPECIIWEHYCWKATRQRR